MGAACYRATTTEWDKLERRGGGGGGDGGPGIHAAVAPHELGGEEEGEGGRGGGSQA